MAALKIRCPECRRIYATSDFKLASDKVYYLAWCRCGKLLKLHKDKMPNPLMDMFKGFDFRGF